MDKGLQYPKMNVVDFSDFVADFYNEPFMGSRLPVISISSTDCWVKHLVESRFVHGCLGPYSSNKEAQTAYKFDYF